MAIANPEIDITATYVRIRGELNAAIRRWDKERISGLQGANVMGGSKLERFMLKELLAIIAALVLVSAVLLTIVITGNY